MRSRDEGTGDVASALAESCIGIMAMRLMRNSVSCESETARRLHRQSGHRVRHPHDRGFVIVNHPIGSSYVVVTMYVQTFCNRCAVRNGRLLRRERKDDEVFEKKKKAF